jgi:hypothetical protein
MGKTNAWQVLLAALERLDGIEVVAHVIDPKAMHKDTLYGILDQMMHEWNNGLFTHILQNIVDNVRGESGERHWVIFNENCRLRLTHYNSSSNFYSEVVFFVFMYIICVLTAIHSYNSYNHGPK